MLAEAVITLAKATVNPTETLSALAENVVAADARIDAPGGQARKTQRLPSSVS